MKISPETDKFVRGGMDIGEVKELLQNRAILALQKRAGYVPKVTEKKDDNDYEVMSIDTDISHRWHGKVRQTYLRTLGMNIYIFYYQGVKNRTYLPEELKSRFPRSVFMG